MQFSNALVLAFAAVAACSSNGSKGPGGPGGPNGPTGPTTGHPRLFFTQADLPALRMRAAAANPLWQNGLLPLLEKQAQAATAARTAMKGDPFFAQGCGVYGSDACEAYAELFALGSLIHPDMAKRQQYAELAHWLVLQVVDEYLNGQMGSEEKDFTESDRSRWNGESLSLAVDWAYDSFSSDERARIQQAFVKLCDHMVNNAYHHPDPSLTNDDAALISDRGKVRWAANNYWAAAMRDIGLMSMAVDAADDPQGQLGNYLKNATKGWLFVFDDLSRKECQGGLCGEGPEYSPQTFSYAAELMLALRSAGRNDPTKYGPQVVRENNPFWSDLVQAWPANLSPTTIALGDGSGSVYQPAWNGDGQKFIGDDAVELLGAIALDARAAGDSKLGDSAAWLATYGASASTIAGRVKSGARLASSIMYFLVVDGTATAPADPRAMMPTRTFLPGMGVVLARSDWTANASWLAWHVGWQSIDHQHADANDFSLFRKGEWLTKETTGYEVTNTDVVRSDAHNTVSVLNNGPTEHSDWRSDLQMAGSQMLYVGDGDPKVLAHSFADAYVYAEGDATATYNSMYESSGSVMIEDVKHVSRALVWLPPDRVLVYDRAETGQAGRFKRVWFHFPSLPTQADARHAVAVTAGKQQVMLSLILPAAASIVVSSWQPADEAMYDTMVARSVTESTDTSARFLHLLEGGDSGATPTAAAAIVPMSGPAVDGAVVAGTAVAFARDVGALTSGFSFQATGAQHVLLTGLTAGTSYAVSKNGDIVTVTPGSGQLSADGALYIP